MGLFDKKEPKPLGASYPFIERIGDRKMLLRYDAMQIEQNGDTITLTFFQEDVPIYAWTYESSKTAYKISGLDGKFEVAMTR